MLLRRIAVAGNGIRIRCIRRYTEGNILKLQDRGFFQDVFPAETVDKARSALGSCPQTIYAGFDPTADSLHVGNLLVIIGLLHSQRAGHQPIALLGGATGQIGDPSGRQTERQAMLLEAMRHNLNCIEAQIKRIFENHRQCLWENRGQSSPLKPVQVVNNGDWYRELNFVQFVSTVGRHFRMGSMLSRASVQSRLQSEAGMSFTEFTYQIFQAYDWLHLLRNSNCRFQLGGSDQMGNIMSGHELISRVEKSKEVFGLTVPLITNEEGDKFGKSAGNAVWLSADKTSPYALYQFFVRTPDAEVEKLLKLLTFLPMDEIRSLMARHKRTPELWEAQKRLAQELTLLVHSEEGLKKAESLTAALYSGNVEALGNLEVKDIRQTFGGAPLVDILPEPGMTVLNVAMRAKCFPTEKDALRIINAGGFTINLNKAKNVSEVLVPGVHILKNGISLLRVGKRNYYIVRWLA
ncbi:tyrosine--tRNA ligase, mitochondrial [Uranotaenia lowii]|uniref:tyrosine--tRNA ligase, mitochondrial n=1 Tax=Uranotaenia lowii TaxID=190385 RepID=UPI00247A0F3F|nr:tyrosine--tRNA ligase, mitochondrial [Uranotaenia lowii]XP_055609496.1 tyrosine--tRNA ligase, mitochondrial [Uranotaenia lowii]